MKRINLVCLLALLSMILLPWPGAAVGKARPPAQEREEPTRREDPDKAITTLIRDLQLDLESSSSRNLLNKIDSSKFDDYPRFEDMVERLLRENSLRAFFRQASKTIRESSAQTILDAEMEISRNDAAGQTDRRHQQIVIDFELTSRGWKIVNITPRDFFTPL
ncbi:MAG: hypothetical protein A3F68_10005 [Acidobacteria bacterium RIFCSPLOWO2_12_FULL_54_10]|nr:MAG: hypothetical protein A3F68_10005 [Acidobacteria bacterium RIFCSPLOWO2_12_FULL_54_10]